MEKNGDQNKNMIDYWKTEVGSRNGNRSDSSDLHFSTCKKMLYEWSNFK